VDPRVKPKKTPISNSSEIFPFAIQRKTIKFPQNKLIHLVTLFLVDSRELPFSEPGPKIPNPKNLSIPGHLASNSPNLTVPIIKGLRSDLILTATRSNITYLLIYFFIQEFF
jgi:hypothetical protein